MIPLYTQEQFDKAKAGDKLTCKCEVCDKPFQKMKRDINKVLRGLKLGSFCSQKCHGATSSTRVKVSCSNCQIDFTKKQKEITKSKTGNHFCSKSCANSFNNKNKSYGTRRSKLEIWVEQQLTLLYPNLPIDYNQKSAIQSELDIYIPSLRLAFELNGIFHCEPIFGQDKLNQVKINDELKFKACAENNITLCMIDTSRQKYFKESTSKQFLDIIIYHINWINLLANLPK